MTEFYLPSKDERFFKTSADSTPFLNTSLSPIASVIKVSLVSLVGLSLAHGAAHAATISVSTFLDDGNSNALCSLREAITAINEAPSLPLNNGCRVRGPFGNNDSINILAENTIVLNQGQLEIAEGKEISIDGRIASGNAILDPENRSRVFDIRENASLFIRNLDIRNGTTDSAGGGIRANSGSRLQLRNSKISDNASTSGGNGGGIYAVDSTIEIIDSTISGNSATNSGGAIYAVDSTIDITGGSIYRNFAGNDGGVIFTRADSIVNLANTRLSNNRTNGDYNEDSNGGAIFVSEGSAVTINNSTLNGNSAFDDGGAIHVDASIVEIFSSTLSNNSALGSGSSGEETEGDGGSIYTIGSDSRVTLSNSTFSGNNAGNDGGALFSGNGAQVTIENSTLSNNTALDYGGGFALFSGSGATISNSIIANSTSNNAFSSGNDCHFATGTTMFIDASTIIETGGCNSVRAIDPGLDLLTFNGGVTETHALQEDSPARGTGLLASCTATDQLGQIRDSGDGLCDVGAIEFLSVSNGFYVVPLGNGKSVVVPF